jgi:hypothetical protein
MNAQQIRERIAAVVAEEQKKPIGWWYTSFANGVFLGGCIVEAQGPATAIKRAHELGINPGGETMTWEIVPEHVPPAVYRNRLLNKTLVDEAFPALTGVKH